MSNQERRRFHRILFDANCELRHDDALWQTQVLDLSLKGVLVKKPEHWVDPLKGPVTLTILLENGTPIMLEVQLKHIGTEQLGFGCAFIDLESVTHLRRLVELNLGDDALLHRELLELGSEMER